MGLVWNLGANDAALKPFQTVANAAAKALPSFGPITVTAQSEYHVAFAYLCCLTKQEAAIVKAAVADNCGAGWSNLSLQLASATYQYNKPASFSVFAEPSLHDEAAMQAAIATFEQCITKRGVTVSVPRARQWRFHLTLGVVGANNSFAGAFAAAEINKLDWESARVAINKAPKCTGALC